MPNGENLQDQEMRRELLRQQRAAAQREEMEESGENQQEEIEEDKKGVRGKSKGEEGQEQEKSVSRSFQRIMARVRQAKEGEGSLGKVEEIKKTVERLKWIYRVINGTAAVTLVGIILTFLVMNLQLILGNLFKVKFVPALSIVEIIVLLFIDFLLFFIILLIVMIIMVVLDILYKLSSGNPIQKIKTFWQGLGTFIDLIKGSI